VEFSLSVLKFNTLVVNRQLRALFRTLLYRQIRIAGAFAHQRPLIVGMHTTSRKKPTKIAAELIMGS